MNLLKDLEQECLQLSGFPIEQTKCYYTSINMDGEDFNVRTFEVGENTTDKKTVVFTHGFVGSSVMYFGPLARLVK